MYHFQLLIRAVVIRGTCSFVLTLKLSDKNIMSYVFLVVGYYTAYICMWLRTQRMELLFVSTAIIMRIHPLCKHISNKAILHRGSHHDGHFTLR